MCTCRHFCHHWTCCYGINDRDGSGTGRSACSHAVEHANEETSKNPGFRIAVLCVNVRSLFPGLTVKPELIDSRASVITMVRIPYVNKFEGGTNLQCKHISNLGNMQG